MLIYEVDSNGDVQKLAAISQFLIGRAQDTGAEKLSVSVKTFINLANTQGISLTADRLKTLSQQPPLDNLIVDVTGDEDTGQVILQGEEGPVNDQMTVDQARITVDSMAKRAAKKGIQ